MKNGGKIMKFSNDFDKYAKEVLNICNPFPKYYANISKYTTKDADGMLRMDIEASIRHDAETLAEREGWIQLRDRYVAERILRELGYEELVTSYYAKFIPDALPCEGAIGQCSFFCPKYFKCGL